MSRRQRLYAAPLNKICHFNQWASKVLVREVLAPFDSNLLRFLSLCKANQRLAIASYWCTDIRVASVCSFYFLTSRKQIRIFQKCSVLFKDLICKEKEKFGLTRQYVLQWVEKNLLFFSMVIFRKRLRLYKNIVHYYHQIPQHFDETTYFSKSIYTRWIKHHLAVVLGHFNLRKMAHLCSHLYLHPCQVELFHIPPVSSCQVTWAGQPFWNPFLSVCLPACLSNWLHKRTVHHAGRAGTVQDGAGDGKMYKVRFIVFTLIIYTQDAFMGAAHL